MHLGNGQVGLSKRYIPFLGDFRQLQNEYADKNKFLGHFYRDLYLTEDAKPVYLFQAPAMNIMLVNDVEWLAELNKLIPKYLDREPIDNTGFGKVGSTGGIGQSRSTEEWKLRRETLMKILGINHASRFIPPFLKYLTENFGKLKPGEEFNFSQTSNTAIFSFILTILFGKNVEKELGYCNYEYKDGRIEQLKLYDCMMTI